MDSQRGEIEREDIFEEYEIKKSFYSKGQRLGQKRGLGQKHFVSSFCFRVHESIFCRHPHKRMIGSTLLKSSSIRSSSNLFFCQIIESHLDVKVGLACKLGIGLH